MNTKIFMKQHVWYYKDFILTGTTWYKKPDKLLRKFCVIFLGQEVGLKVGSKFNSYLYTTCPHSFVAFASS